jgi:methylmalonyl-CoA/ethylmalonyl-CoA epimerase
MANPSIQKLAQVSIHCEDVQRATAFYRDVLGLPFLFAPAPNLAFLMAGDVRLMLTSEGEEGFSGTSALYFQVPDIETAVASIRDHAELIDEPHIIANMGTYNLWMSFFKDTEGNPHALMEERAI